MGLNISLRRHAPLLGLVGFLVLDFTGTGCAGTIQGQVVDAQTGQPVAGAVVLGVWTKVAGLPGLHHHELVGVQEVETDAEGRFILKRAKSIIHEDDESITVYKPGYVAWNNLFIFPTNQRRKDTQVPSKVFMETFPINQSHRRHLDFIDDARFSLYYDQEAIPRFKNALKSEIGMR
jgi:hypothetical protein